MTNQTIDGVSRRVCHACVTLPRNAYCPVCDEEPAAQDEPVAWRVTGRGGLTVTPQYPKWAVGERGLTITPLYAEQPAPVAVITYQQVFKAYEYAESHPHKYLRGTTNWCAAVAHSLNIK